MSEPEYRNVTFLLDEDQPLILPGGSASLAEIWDAFFDQTGIKSEDCLSTPVVALPIPLGTNIASEDLVIETTAVPWLWKPPQPDPRYSPSNVRLASSKSGELRRTVVEGETTVPSASRTSGSTPSYVAFASQPASPRVMVTSLAAGHTWPGSTPASLAVRATGSSRTDAGVFRVGANRPFPPCRFPCASNPVIPVMCAAHGARPAHAHR